MILREVKEQVAAVWVRRRQMNGWGHSGGKSPEEDCYCSFQGCVKHRHNPLLVAFCKNQCFVQPSTCFDYRDKTRMSQWPEELTVAVIHHSYPSAKTLHITAGKHCQRVFSWCVRLNYFLIITIDKAHFPLVYASASVMQIHHKLGNQWTDTNEWWLSSNLTLTVNTSRYEEPAPNTIQQHNITRHHMSTLMFYSQHSAAGEHLRTWAHRLLFSTDCFHSAGWRC